MCGKRIHALSSSGSKGQGVFDHHGGLDHGGVEGVLADFPAQVIWIEGDAVPAKSWSWIESLESVRLGPGCVDNLPDVDFHSLTQHGHFVYQAYVDVSVSVFKDFLHLGYLRG